MFNRRETNISKGIIEKRKRDEQLAGLSGLVSDNQAQKRYIQFEVKSEQIIKQTQLNRITNGLKKMELKSLQDRRSRLAHMLEQDDKVFRAEIDASKETLQQRKERMSKRAWALREKRNASQRQLAQELYTRRFRLGCDELRSLEGDKQKQLVFQGRQQQIAEKVRIRKQEQEQEEYYKRMWIEEGRKKEERHKSDVARLNRLDQEKAEFVREQVRRKENERKAERQRKLDEQRMIMEQADADKQLAAARKREKDDKEQRNREQVARYNKMRLMQKQAKREKDLGDGEALNRLNQQEMERERQNAWNKKMRLKAEQDRYLTHVRRMKEQEAQYQRELNKHIQDELDRGNYKRDMELKRQNDNRDRLMRDVDQARRDQLMIKENRKAMSAKQKQLDLEGMVRLQEENKRIKSVEGIDAYRRNRQIQGDQLRLIAQKQQKRELEKAQAIHERQFINHATHKLDEWLEKEKRDPNVKKPWHGLTKSGWYT